MRNLRASILRGARCGVRRFRARQGPVRRVILLRHVLRNALIATVTLVGLHIGSLLGGAVITESVFAVPGVGRLMVDSIFARDYPVIQALTLILAVIVSIAFLSPTCQMGSTRGWPDDAAARYVAVTPAGGAALGRSAHRRRCAILVLGSSSSAPSAPQCVAPYDPSGFDLRRAAAAAERGASLRHRPVRPGHPLAHHRRLHHRSADRHLRHHRSRC